MYRPPPTCCFYLFFGGVQVLIRGVKPPPSPPVIRTLNAGHSDVAPLTPLYLSAGIEQTAMDDQIWSGKTSILVGEKNRQIKMTVWTRAVLLSLKTFLIWHDVISKNNKGGSILRLVLSCWISDVYIMKECTDKTSIDTSTVSTLGFGPEARWQVGGCYGALTNKPVFLSVCLFNEERNQSLVFVPVEERMEINPLAKKR